MVETFLKMAANFLQMTGIFLRMAETFLKIAGIFLQMAGAFLNWDIAFLKNAGTFLQMAGTFMRLTRTFLQMSGTFLRMAGTFLHARKRNLCFLRNVKTGGHFTFTSAIVFSSRFFPLLTPTGSNTYVRRLRCSIYCTVR
jgi:hypothetical protein